MGKEYSTDWYEILQVSPNADQETIERVYRLLAKRYHPDSARTGNASRFDILTKAYRILSDPEKRASYDAKCEGACHQRRNSFFRTSLHDGAKADKKIYQGILSILYLARRRDALKPAVGIVELEKALGLPETHIQFHIWYLKEKGWIRLEDGGGFAITVNGVEAVMENDLLLRKGLFLPAANDHSIQNGEDRDSETAGEFVSDPLSEESRV